MPHLNPQSRFTVLRGCMFCKQMDLTGEHARACPGKAFDIRLWVEIQDMDGR